MAAGVAAGALVGALTDGVGVRHHIEGAVSGKTVRVDIQQIMAVFVAGESNAVGQQSRQLSSFCVIKGGALTGALRVFEDTAADPDGTVASFVRGHLRGVGAARDLHAVGTADAKVHRRAIAIIADAAGFGFAAVRQGHVCVIRECQQAPPSIAGKGVAVPVDGEAVVSAVGADVDAVLIIKRHILKQRQRAVVADLRRVKGFVNIPIAGDRAAARLYAGDSQQLPADAALAIAVHLAVCAGHAAGAHTVLVPSVGLVLHDRDAAYIGIAFSVLYRARVFICIRIAVRQQVGGKYVFAACAADADPIKRAAGEPERDVRAAVRDRLRRAARDGDRADGV